MTPVLRRRIFVITVIALAAAGTIYGFLPKAVEVELAAAKKDTLQVTIEEEGRTRLKDRFTVSAPVPGFLRRIDLNVGVAIRKGQAVAQLEPLRSPALDPRMPRRGEGRRRGCGILAQGRPGAGTGRPGGRRLCRAAPRAHEEPVPEGHHRP
jgi:hypothetical protein